MPYFADEPELPWHNVFYGMIIKATQSAIGHHPKLEIIGFHAAQDLLSAREWRSIEAIANFCGYDCDSTLRKAFSARLGLSPSAWRNAEKKR